MAYAALSEVMDVKLHPDVSWLLVDDQRLQLRQPDGEHITFDQDVPDILAVLKSLRESESNHDNQADSGIRAALIDLLHTRGLLLDVSDSRNQFQRLLEQHGASGGRLLYDTPPKTVQIAGEGKLADIARNVFQQADIEQLDEHSSLRIVTCDSDHRQFLLEQNSIAVENKQPVLFFHWTQRALRIGPFVVPDQTACLHCAYKREQATSLFGDELEALNKAEVGTQPVFDGGPVLEQLAGALIARQVMTIMNGNYDLARPGLVTTVDPILLQVSHSPILKLPRCPVCSTQKDSPLRAVRDLI
ncbi:TOMM precursor leader peptide-binding protein [Alteromonadaceae bacterium M269]|nr:TOMM precursor leader peptide-binding protein [Alteromonadaceae bacterium M269]